MSVFAPGFGPVHRAAGWTHQSQGYSPNLFGRLRGLPALLHPRQATEAFWVPNHTSGFRKLGVKSWQVAAIGKLLLLNCGTSEIRASCFIVLKSGTQSS